MEQLNTAGAKSFLIFNMPRMGDTPDAQSGGEEAIAAANLYADSYNTALDVALADLRVSPDFDGTIYFVNAYALLSEIVDSVNDTGSYTPDFFVPGDPVTITNVTDEGLDYYDTNGTFPSNYLFWDGVHPTTQGHAIVAGAVLQAVPEPGTVALFALGTLGLILRGFFRARLAPR